MLRGIKAGEATVAAGEGDKGAAAATRSDKAEVTVEEIKLRESAARKRVAKDGKGCLADLDEADKRFPNSPRLSTRPDGMMNIRGECLMLTGQCKVGSRMLRMALEQMAMKTATIDAVVAAQARSLCPGGK